MSSGSSDDDRSNACANYIDGKYLNVPLYVLVGRDLLYKTSNIHHKVADLRHAAHIGKQKNAAKNDSVSREV